MTNLYSIIQASHAGIPMTADETIFGLRFRANGKLQLSIDGLKLFLDSPTKEDKGKLHGDDLAAYRDLLKAVESFERVHGEASATGCSLPCLITPTSSNPH